MRSLVFELARSRALLLIAVLILFPLPGYADPVCDGLEDRLASIPKLRSGGEFQTGNLLRQLRETQFDARRFGCGFRFFGRPQAPFCPQIMGRMAQIRSLLARSTDTGPFDSQRRWVVRQMQANGCMPSRRTSPPKDNAETSAGGLRTLCVRTCDGYFFPISYSVSPSRFKADEAACKRMYPEGEAELFVNRQGEEFDRAISLKGESYQSKPHASTYQKQFLPRCKAKLTEGLAALSDQFAARSSKNAPRKTRTDIPLPLSRPVYSEDPETLGNREGKFILAPAAGGVAALAGEKVRIISAALFPPLIANDGESDAGPGRNQVAAVEAAPPRLMMFITPSR